MAHEIDSSSIQNLCFNLFFHCSERMQNLIPSLPISWLYAMHSIHTLFTQYPLEGVLGGNRNAASEV